MTNREEAIKLAGEAGFVFDGRDWVCAAPLFAFERLIQLAKNEAYREAANAMHPSLRSMLSRSVASDIILQLIQE